MKNKVITFNGIEYKEVPFKSDDKVCKDCDYFFDNGKCCLEVCPAGEDMILKRVKSPTKLQIEAKAAELALKNAKTYTVSKNNSHLENILFNESSILECEKTANEMAEFVRKIIIEEVREWLNDTLMSDEGGFPITHNGVKEFINDLIKVIEK